MKRAAILLMIPFSLSGCASVLYMGGVPNQNNEQGVRTYQTLEDGKSLSPYLNVEFLTTKSMDEYGPHCLLFELTPIGVLGPKFNCPKIQEEIIGTLALKYTVQVASISIDGGTLKNGTIAFDFPRDYKHHSLTAHFNSALDQTLISNGRATKIEPDQILFTLQCNKTVCSVYADPDIVATDGTIRMESKEIVNEERLREIASEDKRHQAEDVKAALHAEHLRESEEFNSFEEAQSVMAPSVKYYAGGPPFLNNPLSFKNKIIIVRMKIVQILTNGQFLLANYPPAEPYAEDKLFMGFISKNYKGSKEFIDDQAVDIVGEVVGTYRYTTTILSEKTIPMIKIYGIKLDG